MAVRDTRILILCKTYPSPSAKYAETSCVAGMEATGTLIRLYPVPFRLINDNAQFKKWQWLEAKVNHANDDRRPESHRLLVDTVKCDPRPLPTSNEWRDRRAAINSLQVFTNFDDLEFARQKSGITLGLLKPTRVQTLDVTPVASPTWSTDEYKKLVQLQSQGGLFDSSDEKAITTLRKLPFDFHYRYECPTSHGVRQYRHKIVDWEAGALYWNVRCAHGEKWENPFRQKMENDLPSKDLMFLMGTIHRFPDQWLIVSLIYPPKQSAQLQTSLLF
jgi:hypothetical protein